MANRYERVCLIENLHNNPDVNVELLAGAVLRDNLEDTLKCQLKFKLNGEKNAYKITVSISCYDTSQKPLEQTIYTYEDDLYEPSKDYGTDTLIKIPSEMASIEVKVESAIFEEDSQNAPQNEGMYGARISVNGETPEEKELTFDEAEAMFKKILCKNPTCYDIQLYNSNKAWIQFFGEEGYLSISLAVYLSESSTQYKYGDLCGTPDFKSIQKILWDFRQDKYDMPSVKWLEDEIKDKATERKQGCYVATCVYGSYDCPQVWTLRRFRDDILAVTWYGRMFIKTYYAISPTLVKWFGHTKWFKKIWQNKLDRMVTKLQYNGVESTPYKDKNY